MEARRDDNIAIAAAEYEDVDSKDEDIADEDACPEGSDGGNSEGSSGGSGRLLGDGCSADKGWDGGNIERSSGRNTGGTFSLSCLPRQSRLRSSICLL